MDLVGERDLLRKGWFGWMLVGGALGAAIGLLRDRQAVLGLLQRVATAIISVLTPILAAGLLLFVLSLPFTGLARFSCAVKTSPPSAAMTPMFTNSRNVVRFVFTPDSCAAARLPPMA